MSETIRRVLAASLVSALFFSASTATVFAGETAAQQLQTARDLIKNARYDEAITSLRELIDSSGETSELRDGYLLLITTYVQRSNYYKGQAQELETSKLYQEKARDTVLEMLSHRAMRDTRLDKESLVYPPEMVNLFDEIRSDIFGAFRVTDLEPPDAVVLLDGDTLRASPDGTPAAANNVDLGRHDVIVERDGYDTLEETVEIAANETLAKSFTLSKKRGVAWWLTRGAAVAGIAVIGGVLIPGGGTDSRPDETSLPGPPDPPTGG